MHKRPKKLLNCTKDATLFFLNPLFRYIIAHMLWVMEKRKKLFAFLKFRYKKWSVRFRVDFLFVYGKSCFMVWVRSLHIFFEFVVEFLKHIFLIVLQRFSAIFDHIRRFDIFLCFRRFSGVFSAIEWFTRVTTILGHPRALFSHFLWAMNDFTSIKHQIGITNCNYVTNKGLICLLCSTLVQPHGNFKAMKLFEPHSDVSNEKLRYFVSTIFAIEIPQWP